MRCFFSKAFFFQFESCKFIVLLSFTLLCVAFSTGCTRESPQKVTLDESASDAEEAGLIGRVKAVRVEHAKFFKDGDRWVEGARQFVSTTRYNDQGNMAEEEFYKPNGLLAVRVAYTYDNQGRHAEEAVSRGEGSPPSKLVYHHDGSGRLIEKMIYRADGAFDWKVHYTYDGRGKKKEVAVYQADGSLSAKRIYRYDGEGNEIEEAVHSAEALVSRGLFSYDARGNRIKETFYLPKGTVSAEYLYAYELDPAGNWIRRSRSNLKPGSDQVDFEHSDVTYRTIRYDDGEAAASRR